MSLSSNWQDDTDLADSVGKVSLAPILDLAKFAISRGMDQESVEGLIGIPLQCADPSSRISSLAGPILFNQILMKGFSNAPALELSQAAPIGVLGGVEKLVLLAPNGHEALRSLSSNFAAFLDNIDTELEATRSYVRFSFSSNADEYDNGGCSEAVLTLLVRLMRFTFGAHGQPHEVKFRYDRNGVASAYEEYFKAPVKFWSQEDRFSIIFKKSNLEHHQLGYDPELFRLAIDRVSKVAELNIDSSPAVEYFQLVTASNYCVRAGIFSVAAVAAKANLGERTAQRVRASSWQFDWETHRSSATEDVARTVGAKPSDMCRGPISNDRFL